ncbi:hypothetical protein KCU81_g2119, partial [Aureobasidium melanogenum]
MASHSSFGKDLEKGSDKQVVTITEKNSYSSFSSISTSSTLVSLSKPELTKIEEPVPPKRQARIIRYLRHTGLNVYRRIFSIVFVANLAGLIGLLAAGHSSILTHMPYAANAAAANFLVAILIRQDYIFNMIFRVCQLVPLSAPLRLRRILAKVYEHGGMHSGCAIAGTMWFILLTVLIVVNFETGRIIHTPLVPIFTVLLLICFLVLCVFAHPAIRHRFHNSFEFTHRFAGWCSIIVFWVDLVLIADTVRLQNTTSPEPLGIALVKLPAFWFLIIMSVHIVLPWLRLRKVAFTAERLSEHAIRLHHKEHMGPYRGIAIAESPLGEWHPFACFPDGDGVNNSIMISHAGDWTRRTIDNPKSHYYVKGVLKTNVLNMASIFNRVLLVTTGTGIGPALSFVAEPSRKGQCQVLWVSSSPEKTFGQPLIDWVYTLNGNAVVWDSKKDGRPDMVALTLRLYKEMNAEAVFVVSNPKLTKQLVYGCESRGIPAYGPIFDS